MNFNADISSKSVIKSFGWKLLERLASQGINLVVQIVLARLLMPDDFGKLAIVVAITNYVSIFVQAGLATAIIQKEDLDDLDISTLLVASLGVAAVLYAVLFAVAPIIARYYESPELIWVIRILSITLFLNAINSIQTAILSRRMQFRRLFLRSLIAVPVSGTVGIVAAYMGLGIWALVAQQLTNISVVVIVMSVGADMRIGFRFSLDRAKKIYAFSGKILISNLITGGYDALRTMVIGRKYDSVALAYYDKANSYSYYVVQIVNGAISSVLLPAFSRKQSNLVELKVMARKRVSVTAFVLFPVLVGVAAVAEPLVLFLLTDTWMAAVPYLFVFCILRLPGCIMSIDKQVYYALGYSDILLKYELGLAVVNLTALLVAIRHSVIAIAVCALVTEYIGAAVLSYVSAKVYDYRIRERLQDLALPAVNSLLMFAVVAWVGRVVELAVFPRLVLQVFVGTISYVVLAYLTKDENLRYCANLIKRAL